MNDIIHTHVNINKLNIDQQYSWINWAKANEFLWFYQEYYHPSRLIQDDFVFNSET